MAILVFMQLTESIKQADGVLNLRVRREAHVCFVFGVVFGVAS